jgi:fatty-acid desaturase
VRQVTVVHWPRDLLPLTVPLDRAAVDPWTRSWFYIAPGELGTFFWVVVIHASALVGLLFLPAPSLWLVGAVIALAFLGGLGTTICYHRALAHRAVRLRPFVEQALTFIACFNGSSHPRGWVASHRQHHAHPDQPGDPSSPQLGGFWWSHIRWLWQMPRADARRWCPDLDQPSYHFWDRASFTVLSFSLLFGLIFGPTAWLWLGPIRLVWSLHAQCSINSIAHLGEASTARDHSRNVAWLAPIILGIGENWHFNHHRAPRRARLGHDSQIDLGWSVIKLMQRLRLASIACAEEGA